MADSHHDFGISHHNNDSMSIPSIDNNTSYTIPSHQSSQSSIDHSTHPHATDETPHHNSTETIACQPPENTNLTSEVIVISPSTTIEQINRDDKEQAKLASTQTVKNTQNVSPPQNKKNASKNKVSTNSNTLYVSAATKKATANKEEEKKSKKSRCQIL